MGPMFSDLSDAMSHGRVHAGWRHKPEYYAHFEYRRNAEIFANQVSIMGSGTMGELLLQRFTPKLYAQTTQHLSRFKGRK